MAVIIKMPKLGLTMEEGTISEWYKSEGDFVNEGDLLFAVETEKVANDVECETEGVLRKIIAKQGETVKCGEAVAIIADLNEDISAIS
ncbi:MAG: biotin/lipoyl-containing protein [Anaerovoracaceae bacterium]|jgi:pyruvate/2-oxoglutarate dehydrogenase complex dihydrolipoamide acyltransferase (E2) component